MRHAGRALSWFRPVPSITFAGKETVSETNDSTGRLLLDSNIWIKEVGLMSRRASTLRLYMQDSGVRLVVPEVVQVEATRHLASRMRTQAAAGRKAHGELLRMLGRLPEWRIPSDNEMAAHAERLAMGVDVPVDHVELGPETALRGAQRCLAKRPPAHPTKRAFVDCMIWEEVINVLRSHDLCFVTNDSGFFDAEGNGNGLHPCLAAEAKAATHELVVQRDLETLLEDFRAEFKMDAELLSKFVVKRGEAITHAAEAMGFEPKGLPRVSYKAFATEKTQKVEVRFASVQPFDDATGHGRSTDGLRIQARAVYGITTGELEEVTMDREELLYVGDDERRMAVPGSIAYGHGQAVTICDRQIASDRRDLIDSA